MQKLFKISEKKKKLKKLVEFILYLMASDMQYKQSAVELIMQNQSSVLDTSLTLLDESWPKDKEQ